MKFPNYAIEDLQDFKPIYTLLNKIIHVTTTEETQ